MAKKIIKDKDVVTGYVRKSGDGFILFTEEHGELFVMTLGKGVDVEKLRVKK